MGHQSHRMDSEDADCNVLRTLFCLPEAQNACHIGGFYLVSQRRLPPPPREHLFNYMVTFSLQYRGEHFFVQSVHIELRCMHRDLADVCSDCMQTPSHLMLK
jgi:hypothetical protein